MERHLRDDIGIYEAKIRDILVNTISHLETLREYNINIFVLDPNHPDCGVNCSLALYMLLAIFFSFIVVGVLMIATLFRMSVKRFLLLVFFYFNVHFVSIMVRDVFIAFYVSKAIFDQKRSETLFISFLSNVFTPVFLMVYSFCLKKPMVHHVLCTISFMVCAPFVSNLHPLSLSDAEWLCFCVILGASVFTQVLQFAALRIVYERSDKVKG